MLSVVVMLNVVILSVISEPFILNVVNEPKWSVVVMLNAVMLSVVAPI